MNVISADQHERSRRFEYIVDATSEALAHPAVMRELGPCAVELAFAANNCFLPNVRGGVVSLPSEEYDTNNFALLPLGPDELNGELRVATNMYLPTRRHTLAYLQRAGTREQLMDTVERIGAILGRTPPEESNYAKVMTAAVQYPNGNWFRCRPILYWWMMANSRVTTAVVGAHELMHGLQYERDAENKTAIESTEVSQAAGELEGYHVGAVIEKAYGDNSAVVDYSDTSIEVLIERLRCLYAKPGMPYNATPEVLDVLRRYGLLGEVTSYVV